MTLPDFRANCTACAALCCMALAMDKSEAFAIDKPAGLPCPNLDAHRCKIHKTLEWEGFPGCRAYDCLGAGQRVTQELFGGQSWREHPRLALPMIETFRQMRLVHELLQLLLAAKALPLPDAVEAERAALIARLTPESWSEASLLAFETGALPGEVRAFLQGLKAHVRR
jgi:hypothetical protein